MILPGCRISRGYAVRVQCFVGARRHGRVPRRNLIVTSAGGSSWKELAMREPLADPMDI